MKVVRWWLRHADSQINYKGWYHRKKGFILNVRRNLLSDIKANDFADDTYDNYLEYCKFKTDELGSELVTSGDFSAETGWTLTDVTIADGKLNLVSEAGTATQDLTLEADSLYQVSVDIDSINSGSFDLFLGTSTITRKLRKGVMDFVFKNETAGTVTLSLECDNCDIVLNSISVKKVV